MLFTAGRTLELEAVTEAVRSPFSRAKVFRGGQLLLRRNPNS
jgi:hypothetical protein